MAAGKVKVWRTVMRSFAFPFARMADVARTLAMPLGLWLLLSLPLTAYLLFVFRFRTEHVQGLIVLLGMFLFTPGMIKLYRIVLLREEAELLSAVHFVRRDVFEYLAALVTILVIAVALGLVFGLGGGIAAAALGLILAGKAGAGLGGVLGIAVASIALWLFLPRYLLSLPNVAVGGPLRFKETVRLSRGNRWRLGWIMLLTMLPFCLINPLYTRHIQAGSLLSIVPLAFLFLSGVLSSAVQAYALADVFRELLIIDKARQDGML